MNNKNIVVIIAALCVVIMGACFSSWDGSDDQGSIVINLGNGGARAADGEDYAVFINSGETSLSKKITGGGKTVFAVQPGLWNIVVHRLNSNGTLNGFGKTDVEVIAGTAVTASISIDKVTQKVSTWKELKDMFESNKGQNEIVIIENDLDADNSLSLPAVRWNITLLTEKEGGITITKSYETSSSISGNSLFRVLEGCELTLGGTGKNITITSNTNANKSNSNSSLVYVQGGKLILNSGVTLTNNSTKETSIARGGGVTVYNNGTFIMNGGTISGNSTVHSGGGVYVNSGTFRKIGGTIYGPDSGDNSNTAAKGGHAVYGPGTRAINKTLGPNDKL